MKHTLLIITALMLVVGCSKEPINIDELVKKGDIFYTKDTNKPYSGPVFSLYKNGQKKEEGTYKDGEKDGKWTSWFWNGQKSIPSMIVPFT
jgi:antitoxin component YwqK of YwqJK toxin-antitoxin module